MPAKQATSLLYQKQIIMDRSSIGEIIDSKCHIIKPASLTMISILTFAFGLPHFFLCPRNSASLLEGCLGISIYFHVTYYTEDNSNHRGNQSKSLRKGSLQSYKTRSHTSAPRAGIRIMQSA